LTYFFTKITNLKEIVENCHFQHCKRRLIWTSSVGK